MEAVLAHIWLREEARLSTRRIREAREHFGGALEACRALNEGDLFFTPRPGLGAIENPAAAQAAAGRSGARNVTRTRDLLITNQLLYRLSYSSAPLGNIPRRISL